MFKIFYNKMEFFSLFKCYFVIICLFYLNGHFINASNVKKTNYKRGITNSKYYITINFKGSFNYI